VFSPGYDIGNLEGREFGEARELVAHPFHAAIEALEPTASRSSRRSTATRSAAASSWRSRATSASRRAA
jgi:hypothetical protein